MTATCNIICADTHDRLCTVAIPHERDMADLLRLVLEAARRADGVFAKMAAIAVEVGDDVLCEPMPVNGETAAKVWAEIRVYWLTPQEQVA